MKYKQMQLILEPMSIEELLSQNIDDETLGEAMLMNWDTLGTLTSKDESWSILQELDYPLFWDDISVDHDTYKGIDYRSLIIKIKDRFFAYNYTSSAYDNECWDWREVKPVQVIKYTVEYIDKEDNKSPLFKAEYDPHYTELFERKK